MTQQVTAHVVASGNQLIEDAARLSAQESFLSAASLLKSNVSNVRLALQSRVNHPELASDERKGLRDFSDQDVICGQYTTFQCRKLHRVKSFEKMRKSFFV